MPKKITTVRFACSVCERKHTRKEAAEKCESKGIAVPEFHQCQVVEYIGESDKHKPSKGSKVIVLSHGHRIYLKPTYIHQVPSIYEVYFRNDVGLWSARIDYYLLKKITDFDGDHCPLCGSIEVFDSTREDYQIFTSLFPKKLPQLGTVVCKECPNCKRKFFTSDQFAEVEKNIKLGIEAN